jgi:biotin carboxyl carrier protein
MGARYLTWIDGEEATVEILEDAEGAIRARIEVEDMAPREVAFQRLDSGGVGGGFQLTLPDGRSVEGRLASVGKGARILTTGDHRLEVQALSERDAWMSDGVVGQDSGEVTVSMPGKVIQAMVAVGDEVEQGQPVMIIEAMKMENEVKSGRAGVVIAIHVSAGQSVEADVVLMEIGDA